MMSLQQVEHYLASLMTKVSATTGRGITVDRMWPLLEKVGNPQEKLKVIHVAGTSGKTSTSYFIASLLAQTGKKVGLTVSPHILSITERLQVNGMPLDDEQFCRLFSEFRAELGESPDATYFEYLIVFILWAFVQLGVDYAVVETGLGGLHDGTNVCRRADKVCVITDIGYDHQHILGSTLEEIATQKAGIIHEQNHVFMYEQSSEINHVFQAMASQKHATLEFAEPIFVARDESLPAYQQRNWNLAEHVFSYIAKRDSLKALEADALRKTKVQVPGRMHEVTVSDGQLFVLDGAHNQQKMQALVESFIKKYGEKKIPIVLAIKQDKDYDAVVKELVPIASVVLCCGYNTQQDTQISSASPEEIAEVAKRHAIPAQIFASLSLALSHARVLDAPVVLVTGSLYGMGDSLKQLRSL